MTRPRTLTALLAGLACALMILVWPSPAQAQDASAPLLRVYESRFLGSNTAIELALQVCGEDHERCRLERLTDTSFTIRASEALHSEFSALLAERDVPPATQEFRVILLEATREGTLPDLPEGARQALEDLVQVLPYRGFRQVDMALMRTADYASTRIGEAGAFTVELRFQGDPRRHPGLQLDFEFRHSFGETRQIMSSSFATEVGDTVVVGTSRVNSGEEALVVLLTPLRPR